MRASLARRISVSALTLVATIALSFGVSSEAWGSGAEWDKAPHTLARKGAEWDGVSTTTTLARNGAEWDKVSTTKKGAEWDIAI